MKRVHIAAAVILNASRDQVFITKRPAKAHKGGFWEFPGGKVEKGESAQEATVRELYEEIGIHVTEITHFEALKHDYPDKSLAFDFFVVTDFDEEPYGKEGQEGEWVRLEKLKDYDFPEANVPVLEKVLETYGA
ncbi:Mutator mutT protein [Vibrio nigripulchritudo MADA3029]|uniref:8-oxo-dGTP diphosphatase n=1 Tax=Vibrio nigripulchritudo TaxID=28173 RepID=U4K1G7_9VIBR|nr:8-oxo-dGTP diphosphatase MutT [Vibrio nigripulchritudo]EGU51276.1 mutator MutT protein [Vibrio nigripulchritudo ATCC 27043]KJY71664.1 7,8-dihydro-8-oxoguanine-triphosphatase [Vibrio nigripulchritudo]CCN46906.1 Mutator mutT protein [Vibrio nigripulchritudo MADA3020]CCN51677.1 Mutator mutT protein [Vibrio nigripulchritudo MADA3021]CCN57283.1 Mutator mutT protein [Vibrio nigripulchritudo MADA3029]